MGRLPEPPDHGVKNGCAGGGGHGAWGGDGWKVAAGQTGDVESQARQLHKEGHGAEAKGGRAWGRYGRAASVKSGGVRGLGSSSAVMKTLTAPRDRLHLCLNLPVA